MLAGADFARAAVGPARVLSAARPVLLATRHALAERLGRRVRRQIG